MRYEGTLTIIPICVTARKMGRKMLYPEKMIAPFPEGTFERMKPLLAQGEDKTDFIRKAVQAELDKREKAAKRQG